MHFRTKGARCCWLCLQFVKEADYVSGLMMDSKAHCSLKFFQSFILRWRVHFVRTALNLRCLMFTHLNWAVDSSRPYEMALSSENWFKSQ